ncbi:helix-turn-helix domain-containing protein [Bizionia sp.]|uniref:helix-turn-helix domain-containing protein n=1 Tax=Bizionia sp. TaxID=1954480 RepID=UPI003A90B17C
MTKNVTQVQEVTPEQMANLVTLEVKGLIEKMVEELSFQKTNHDLLTPEQTCELLKIHNTTLWRWTKEGKLTSYGIANRRYYKRGEIINALTQLTKPI